MVVLNKLLFKNKRERRKEKEQSAYPNIWNITQ